MKISNFRLGIGVPSSWEHVTFPFFTSFIQMERPDFEFIPVTNGPIDAMRCVIAEQALRLGCSHLLMLDTDHVLHPQTVTKLLANDVDICGAMTYKRYPPFDPILLKGTIKGYRYIYPKRGDTDLVEVDGVGAAILMIKTEVFENIQKPWFKFEKFSEDDDRPIGEDLYFCWKAKQAGYKIHVDPSIPCGHITKMVVDYDFFEMYNQSKWVELVCKENKITTKEQFVNMLKDMTKNPELRKYLDEDGL